jgi:tripartite-type tricarboxylate transporter receptor subunit TctC
MPRRSATIVLAMLAMIAAAPPASAADYPTKPVQIINQAAPGSGTDVLGRIAAEQLAQRLGQQVVIVNRPGAGGLIAGLSKGPVASGAELELTAQPNCANHSRAAYCRISPNN